ncbi:hypothetical protein [Roseivivax sp. CAU 1761]
MRRACAAAAMLIALAPGPAAAGAWPREPGSVFASLATHLSWPQDIATWTSSAPTGRYDALYLEYGLTPRLTLGLDLGRGVSGSAKTAAFLRLPLGPPERDLKLAIELGLGQIDGALRLRPGLNLGYGFARGWLAADLVVEQPLSGAAPDVKLDLTFGLTLPAARKLILQLQAGQQAGDPAFLRLAPSLVVPLGESRFSAEIGGAWGLAGDASMGLKLGLWAQF